MLRGAETHVENDVTQQIEASATSSTAALPVLKSAGGQKDGINVMPGQENVATHVR